MRWVSRSVVVVVVGLSWGSGGAVKKRIATFVPERFPSAFVGGKRAIPFRPSDEEVAKVEKALAAHLANEQPALAKRAFGYYRQYTGLDVQGGPRTIRGNFLCTVSDDKWEREWIVVKDGGDCFFNFSYDAKSGAIRDLEINGEA